jgi:hypothetical protein
VREKRKKKSGARTTMPHRPKPRRDKQRARGTLQKKKKKNHTLAAKPPVAEKRHLAQIDRGADQMRYDMASGAWTTNKLVV